MEHRIEQIGDCRLILGDCREILPTLGKVDAVVTDPPYGIGITSHSRIGNNGYNRNGHRLGARVIKQQQIISDWDKAGLTKEQWFTICAITDIWIVWGGNHLAHVIGSSAGMLVWDKKCQDGWDDDFSEMEVAWTNVFMRVKGFRHLWAGAIRASERKANAREHPTQKPIALMEWCLSFLPEAKTVCDPFFGSGTTAIACVRTGRRFVGCEINPAYFDIACRRISDAVSRPDMFIETSKQAQPAPPSLFDEAAE